MPWDSIGSATDANMSRIAESRVPIDQTPLVPSVHIVTSRRTDALHPSSRIAGSDIPACHKNTAAMKRQAHH